MLLFLWDKRYSSRVSPPAVSCISQVLQNLYKTLDFKFQIHPHSVVITKESRSILHDVKCNWKIERLQRNGKFMPWGGLKSLRKYICQLWIQPTNISYHFWRERFSVSNLEMCKWALYKKKKKMCFGYNNQPSHLSFFQERFDSERNFASYSQPR